MITCVVEYEIDSRKIADFQIFAEGWMRLVNEYGGTHHGYFLPSEGASDKALALFSFESLAAYEAYRAHFGVNDDFIQMDIFRDQTECVVRYQRSFIRPLFP